MSKPQSVFDLVSVTELFTRIGCSNPHGLIRDLYCKLKSDLPENPSYTPHFWKSLNPNMSDKICNALVQENYVLLTSKVVRIAESPHDNTAKLVLELASGLQIETCIIRFASKDAADPKAGRHTLCVSSQVGCAMACTFCATGTMKLQESLTCGEIVEQYIHAWNHDRSYGEDKLRNIVFMGMGEPLDNYENVISAVRFFEAMGFASYRITVSTVGFHVDRIRRLIIDAPNVSLAVSLHAANQQLRDKILGTKTNIQELLDACFEFVAHQKMTSKKKTKRQALLIEYCIIGDTNDQPIHAHELGTLLAPEKANVIVNIIPYNSTDVSIMYHKPSPEVIRNFYNILTNEYHLAAFLRGEHGGDIASACGQLVKKIGEEAQTNSKPCEQIPESSPSDIGHLRAICDLHFGDATVICNRMSKATEFLRYKAVEIATSTSNFLTQGAKSVIPVTETLKQSATSITETAQHWRRKTSENLASKELSPAYLAVPFGVIALSAAVYAIYCRSCRR